MHPALCHKDRKIRSAARQARGVLISEHTIMGVRTIEELADRIMSKLDYPEKLGADDQRRDVLIAALYSLREARLISVHRKSAQARITTKGKHADSLMPKRSRTGRRRSYSAIDHALA
ncbi:MAG TPA: hypothetical protein VGE34_04430 [Candidatus Saccharimonadales bacterium]